jgi:hypothetical protein
MRNLWTKIGLGAAGVFAVGMFFITLGRQVRTAAADAIRSGGRVAVPLSILPFNIDGRKAGSVREIHVERHQVSGSRRLNVVVTLKGADVKELGDCALVIGGHGPRGLFDCETVLAADASRYLEIGEVRFEPSGIVRPILVERHRAKDWASDLDGGEVHIQAGAEGTNLLVTDGDGNATIRLSADKAGVVLNARDEQGREVVQLKANADGVKLEVKADAKKP